MHKVQRSVEYHKANGVRQYLLHHPSPDKDAPVMLIVHGGPGFPDSNAAPKVSRMWGDLFHIVSWDQRGCGKTRAANPLLPSYSITAEDILNDMVGVVDHLKQKYGVNQLYLLGISWGTILCSLYTLRHPENVKMYIAAGQYCNFFRNEISAYAKVTEAARAAGNKKDLDLLASLAPYPQQPFTRESDMIKKKLPVFKRLQEKYRLMMQVDLQLLWALFASPVARFSDLFAYTKKSAELNANLMDYLLNFEILDCGTIYEVPVCYIVGDRDYQTSIQLATEYFESIQAPKKLLCVIEDASHNMIFDQPAAFSRALADAKALAEN